MKSVAIRFLVPCGIAALLVTGCVASSVTPPVDGPPPGPSNPPAVEVSDSSPAAPRAPLSPEAACWERFVSYCPEDGPATCTAKEGVVNIDKCSTMGGHCVEIDSQRGFCVKGPAAVCDSDRLPKQGDTCKGSTSCVHMSRMGVAQCDCNAGHWDCGHAGI
jgi:hypothetical protein